ncbi:MAG: hypothetical protein ACREC6_10520 [Hyphomicrobiaceae bacterium]
MPRKNFLVGTVLLLQALAIVGLLWWIQNIKPPATVVEVAKGKVPPVIVLPIKDSNLKKLILTARAMERLDVKTAPVQQQSLERVRTMWGEIVAGPSDSPNLYIRVPRSSEIMKAAHGKPVTVSALGSKSAGSGLTAAPAEAPSPDLAAKNLFYTVNGTSDFKVEQRVRIEYHLDNSGVPQKVVPYSAVLYDPQGGTWVYTNPEPLAYVRHSIAIADIEGDLAILSDGPPLGTTVVTVAGALLFGAEKFGK